MGSNLRWNNQRNLSGWQAYAEHRALSYDDHSSVNNGALTGNVVTISRGGNANYGFQATRHVETAAALSMRHPLPAHGSFRSKIHRQRGESIRFIVQQHGPEVAASILRVDGDTGAYTGTYKDGKWVLSHFDGFSPWIDRGFSGADGTLEIHQNGGRQG